MATAEFLRKIKDICDSNKTCYSCPLDNVFCNASPSHWTDNEIGIMAITIDNYKKEEKDGIHEA